MTLVSTRELSCHFGGIRAVDNVDFDLKQSEVRAIIGPNGAGKSTFVGMLCGRQRPTHGKIFLEDVDITTMPAHLRVARGIAYTFQITSVFGNLTSYDNVELAAQRSLQLTSGNTLIPSALRAATMESLVRVGLENHSSTLARNMSYGHQRLLEIAMGLALKPKVLMLDEPTQGLADAEIDNFIQLVHDVAKSATVLLIEHNMAVVMELAQKITVFDAGKILAEGTPEAIRLNREVQLAYLGT